MTYSCDIYTLYMVLSENVPQNLIKIVIFPPENGHTQMGL